MSLHLGSIFPHYNYYQLLGVTPHKYESKMQDIQQKRLVTERSLDDWIAKHDPFKHQLSKPHKNKRIVCTLGGINKKSEEEI